MSSLASLAGKFTEIEKQIKEIKITLSELEALQQANVVGQLTFVVASVNGDATDVVNLSVVPSEANVSLSKLRNLGVGKSTELQLKSKEITIGVSCTVPAREDSGADIDYSADFDLKDVDDNASLSTELELKSNNGETLKVHVKATYDTVDGLVQSKRVELSEAEKTKTTVLENIKKSKNVAGNAKKEKKTKKTVGKRPMAEDTPAVFNVDDEEPSSLTNVIAGATEVAVTGAQLALTHRAVIFFGLASWAILTMGEYASI